MMSQEEVYAGNTTVEPMLVLHIDHFLANRLKQAVGKRLIVHSGGQFMQGILSEIHPEKVCLRSCQDGSVRNVKIASIQGVWLDS